ncbi:MAG: D-alanyl-D-alanine carboxypeptidase [Clostridia bacterium]|nr:D-alanyl-D-alanine carboxypeptidase [Clostridia bacterium]
MRKAIFFLFSMVILVSPLTLGASASYNSELETSSNILYMSSLDNGTVIFDKNADLKTAPASLTKIITGMVVLENCKDFSEVVAAPTSVIRSFDGKNSSNAGIVVGEEIAVDDLLHLMLIKSANEAAAILAYHVGGDNIDNFIVMMNDFVKKIGCKNTHFANPHGLDEEGQYTTARDLSIIVNHALKNEKFVEITSTNTYYLPPTNKRPEQTRFYSTNFLISPSTSYYYEYAKGIKTGTTELAGCCLISTASKNGYTYLCIAMQGPFEDVDGNGTKDNLAFIDSKKAFEWAFKNLKLKVVADPSNVVTVVNVNLSSKVDHVRLMPKDEISDLIPTKVDSTGILIEPIADTIPESLDAPIKKGDVIGKARVMYADKELRTIDLVAGENIDRNIFLYVGHLIKTAFKSTTVKIIAIVALLLLIFYIIINILYFKKKKKSSIYMVKDYRNLRR